MFQLSMGFYELDLLGIVPRRTELQVQCRDVGWPWLTDVGVPINRVCSQIPKNL